MSNPFWYFLLYIRKTYSETSALTLFHRSGSSLYISNWISWCLHFQLSLHQSYTRVTSQSIVNRRSQYLFYQAHVSFLIPFDRFSITFVTICHLSCSEFFIFLPNPNFPKFKKGFTEFRGICVSSFI